MTNDVTAMLVHPIKQVRRCVRGGQDVRRASRLAPATLYSKPVGDLISRDALKPGPKAGSCRVVLKVLQRLDQPGEYLLDNIRDVGRADAAAARIASEEWFVDVMKLIPAGSIRIAGDAKQ